MVRFRVVGAESRGRAQGIESLIEPALLHQCDSEIVGEHPVRGAQLEGATQAGRGLVGLAEGIADTPEPRPELGVTRLVLDGLAVELLGLGQGAEALETGGEGRNVGRRDHDGARRASRAKPRPRASHPVLRRLVRPCGCRLWVANSLRSSVLLSIAFQPMDNPCPQTNRLPPPVRACSPQHEPPPRHPADATIGNAMPQPAHGPMRLVGNAEFPAGRRNDRREAG